MQVYWHTPQGIEPIVLVLDFLFFRSRGVVRALYACNKIKSQNFALWWETPAYLQSVTMKLTAIYGVWFLQLTMQLHGTE